MLPATKQTAICLLSTVLLSGCLHVVLSQNLTGTETGKQPNIIVIMADDLGWNDISFHGADEIPTPNIDALAYNGVILNRHYVLPICTPSRTAYLTGRYPIRAGMQGIPLNPAEPRGIPLETKLLPEYLRNIGYSTHLIGKWHVGYFNECYTPAYRGFDTFQGYYNGYTMYFNHTIAQSGHVGYDLHSDVPGNLSVEYNYEYITDLIADKAERIIKNHDPAKPLYIQLSHDAAHSSDSPDVMEVRDMKEVNSTLGYIEDFNRRKFAGVVTAMDESVGRVVKALKDASMLENSIIVFMSDNGAQTTGFLQNYGSNYPLRGLKFTLFEGGIRGAACIYSPLIKNTSRVSDELMHITDWFPTFYSAAGGDVSKLDIDLDGVDQWSSIVSGGPSKRSGLLVNIDEVEITSGAIVGRHKLIKNPIILYNGYYGDNGMSASYPKYNVSNVLQSPAGSAIASVSATQLQAENVSQLRKQATVVCKNFTLYTPCFIQCLFDIYSDPCETQDLSWKHPDIVLRLGSYIDDYWKVLKHQTNTLVDPAGFPEHFNGTWMPWKDIPETCSPLQQIS